MSNANDWIRAEWLNAQAGCIGCVLQSPKLAGQLLAETSVEDFDGHGRSIYQAISHLFSDGKSPDPVSVGELTQGAYNEYLLQCMEIVPSVLSMGEYIETVKKRSRMSRLQVLFQSAAMAPTMDAMSDYMAQANEMLVEADPERVYDLGNLILGFYERKKKGETYLSTGMQALDARVYLSKGDYGILAGQPSRGKTVLALQLALAQSRRYRVGFFSLETSKDKIMDRLVCHYAKVDMGHIKLANLTPEDWERAGKATTALSQYYHLDVIEAAGMTVDDIFHIALSRRYEIIYIDYLQIINGSGKSRYEIVTNISVRLHQLSQRHKIMTVALSQLSRASDNKKSEEPDMHDLRESGQIEQDADVVMMLYCKEKDNTEGPRILKISKNKEGNTGKLELEWDGAMQTFTPLSRRSAPPLPRRFRELPNDTPVPEEFEQTTMTTGER